MQPPRPRTGRRPVLVEPFAHGQSGYGDDEFSAGMVLLGVPLPRTRRTTGPGRKNEAPYRGCRSRRSRARAGYDHPVCLPGIFSENALLRTEESRMGDERERHLLRGVLAGMA